MTELIKPLPFTPPSQELLDALHALEEHQRALDRITGICAWVEWQGADLCALVELTPLQVQSMLERGRLA